MARSILLEILSADPIGPLSLVQGRTAVQGDILGNLLAFTGETVQREYYVNDMGQRTLPLCETVRQWALARSEGDVAEGRFDRTTQRVADQLLQQHGPGMAELSEESWRELCSGSLANILLDLQRQTLGRLGVRFDSWFEEKSLAPASIESALQRLRDTGEVQEVKGALWLRGASRDRTLLRRNNGDYTYFAVDVAYHVSKAERGAEALIDVWGPAYDRHRMKLTEALRLLDVPVPLEVIVTGPIRLQKDGLPVNYLDAASLMLDSLLEHGSANSLRYILNQAAPEEDLVLELDSLEGSRTPSPLETALQALSTLAEDASSEETPGSADALEAAIQPVESDSQERLHSLRQFIRMTPGLIRRAADQRSPHLLNRHLAGFAAIGGEPSLEGSSPAYRRALSASLKTTLELMGIRET